MLEFQLLFNGKLQRVGSKELDILIYAFEKIILGFHAENDAQGDKSRNREIREAKTSLQGES